ncbi:hypothetical protein E2C01_038336 [Portunus trituberculatus]|uniref:Uncharacterized protein n=1 Tax=Portunus trituberculatus TaxID=210409 RepID=A0A5B7FIA1_PORTR|nr:hypothetical protein [Portunus trituberculatus]
MFNAIAASAVATTTTNPTTTVPAVCLSVCRGQSTNGRGRPGEYRRPQASVILAKYLDRNYKRVQEYYENAHLPLRLRKALWNRSTSGTTDRRVISANQS